ncbi:glycosyltransferase family 4 protein [Thermus composti]|uniref:Glycosyltransferase family 4 protein n=1 Tax=Thermus composti TaxID=532059 RepID=A0ABV6Q2Y3_9DEIN|nr:glycosyltransferase family 4 protein [Thermus composti]
MKRVLFLRSNPIDPDPRVEKEAKALAEAGYQVRVLGWDRLGGLPRREVRDFGVIERLPVKGAFGTGLANLPSLLKFQLTLLWYLLRKKGTYDVLHACDFDTILPALLVGRLFGKKVVYDIFDFYADMLRRTPTWLKKLVRFVDLKVIGWVDAVILADEARKEQIRGSIPKRLVFIYNSPDVSYVCPAPPPPPPLRIVYVGLLQVERGILEVLRVLERHPDWELDLAGLGGDEKVIAQKAKGMSNVRFHGRVPYAKALELSCQAHVLFATYDPSIPNHRFSSANKLFEAMALGKPIIVARDTGMDRLVKENGLGFVVDYGSLEQLEAAFREVEAWSLEERSSFAQRVRLLYEEKFAWERIKERLVELYGEYLR